MFDKFYFKEVLEKALGGRKIAELAEACGVTRPYLSKYINAQLDNPPSPEILRKIALQARNGVDYHLLMFAAGYLDGIPEISQELIPPRFQVDKVTLTKPTISSLDGADIIPNISEHIIDDDSMINLHIQKGDQLSVLEQDYAENDNIVLVKSSSGELLVRKFAKVNNIVMLCPANENYSPLAFINSKFSESFTILGRVIFLLHQF